MKPVVAKAALDRGVAIVNDVTAFRFDPAMASVVAEAEIALQSLKAGNGQQSSEVAQVTALVRQHGTERILAEAVGQGAA